MDERRRALQKKTTISVYLTAAQKERIEAAAYKREKRVSEFLRDLGLQAAESDASPRRGRPRKSGR